MRNLKTRVVGVMDVNEEQLAFYEWVGRAITGWAHVEIGLAQVLIACFEGVDAQAAAIAFYSVENFRSKLRVVDNVVSAKLSGVLPFKDWPELVKRAESAATGRNTIAHHWLLVDLTAKPGRRFGLQPFLSNKQAKRPQRRPPGTLCLRDISLLQSRFAMLSNAFCNFAARLGGHPAPMPESSEEDAQPRTLAALRSQLYTLCGHSPRPSRADKGAT
jgi:hypothetical protein